MTPPTYRWPIGPRELEDDADERERYEAELVASRSESMSLRETLTESGPAGFVWTPVGPSATLDDRVSSVRHSGRVRDIRVSPPSSGSSADDVRVYIAAAHGGPWGSPDGGLSWYPLGGWGEDAYPDPPGPLPRDWGVASGGCLHVRFGDSAATDEVWVGTGEGRAPDVHSRASPGGHPDGVGVLHAQGPLDAVMRDRYARPWTRIAAELEGKAVYALIEDPTDEAVLGAATSEGFWTGSATDPSPWHVVELLSGPLEHGAGANVRVTDAAVNADGLVALAVCGTYASGVYLGADGLGGGFVHVDVSGVEASNLVKSMRVAFDPAQPSVVFAALIDQHRDVRLVRIDDVASAGPLLVEIQGVPTPLDPSETRFALTVHTPDSSAVDAAPALPQVFLGGTTCTGGDVVNPAALFACDLFADSILGPGDVEPADRDDWVGRGVHADICRILIPPGRSDEVWVVGDGGVFCSKMGGARDTFVSRNDGLANLEAGFVAAHPLLAQELAIGTQDNGVLARHGVGLGKDLIGGDGGGVVFHPRGSGEVFAQHYHGVWASSVEPNADDLVSNGGDRQPIEPVLRRLPGHTGYTQDQKIEAGWDSVRHIETRSLFYSECDVVEDQVDGAMVALGTDRVWVGWDWDAGSVARWCTLPTGTDPLADVKTAGQDRRKDRGFVVSCRWAGPDRLYVLWRSAGAGTVVEYVRQGATWDEEPLAATDLRSKSDLRLVNDLLQRVFFPRIPPLAAPTALAIDHRDGEQVSLFVTTVGIGGGLPEAIVGPEEMNMERAETLYWYDGAGRWFPTGLATVDPGPAYSVVVVDEDDDGRSVVVGTASGVWAGTRAASESTDDGLELPRWDWQPLSLGLPAQPVRDLAYSTDDDGTRLLRAAMPACGVWELDLAQPIVERTYFRTHKRDDARTLPVPSPAIPGDEPWEVAWTLSPDIVLQPREGVALTETERGRRSHRRFAAQTAVFANDQHFDVSDSGDTGFEVALQRWRTANGLTEDDDEVQGPELDLLEPHFFARPWRTPTPTEADLTQRCLPMSTYQDNRQKTRSGPKWVHVLVHHRGNLVTAGEHVTVALLARAVPIDWSVEGDLSPPSAALNMALPNTFGAQALAFVRGARTDPPDGWLSAGAPQTLRKDLETRHAVSVSFPFDLTDDTLGFDEEDHSKLVVFLALVDSVADPIATGEVEANTLEALVRNSPHVACLAVETDFATL